MLGVTVCKLRITVPMMHHCLWLDRWYRVLVYKKRFEMKLKCHKTKRCETKRKRNLGERLVNNSTFMSGQKVALFLINLPAETKLLQLMTQKQTQKCGLWNKPQIRANLIWADVWTRRWSGAADTCFCLFLFHKHQRGDERLRHFFLHFSSFFFHSFIFFLLSLSP